MSDNSKALGNAAAPHNILRGTSIVSSLTVLSRAFGFVRDLLLARLFGGGAIADAFFVAFRIPNLLRSFVAEGALTSAFVPTFATELASGKKHAVEAFRTVLSFLLVVTLCLSALGILFAPEIVHFIAPGFGEQTGRGPLCEQLTRIMFPYILFVSIVAAINGALISLKVYGTAPLAQIVMNICLIIAAITAGFFEGENTVLIMAWSVLLGGALQILFLFPALKRAGLLFLPSAHVFTRVTRQIVTLMLPAIVGAAVYQLSVLLNTVFASMLKTGSVSWLFYADRLTQFPLGVFSIALASVLLPTLSQDVAQKDEQQYGKHLIDALRFTSFTMIPVAAGLLLISRPLVIVAFERGAFSSTSSGETALAVAAYAIGLWGVSCHSMVVRAFLARKDTVTPTCIGLLSLTLSVLVGLVLMGPPVVNQGNWAYEYVVTLQAWLGTFLPTFSLGHVGLALGTSVAGTLSFLAAAFVLAWRLRGDKLPWGEFIGTSIRALCAASAMAFCVFWAMLQCPLDASLTQLAVAVPTGVVTYVLFSSLLGLREIKETFHAFCRLQDRRKKNA